MHFPQTIKSLCLLMAATGFLLFMTIIPALAAEYETSTSCLICHTKIFEQHAQSMHERSFTNPVFRAQYFNELLPETEKDPELLKEAQTCIACHSPITYIKLGRHVTLVEQVNPRMSGVTCDFCHTIKGYTGEAPGNGNYISEPGPIKLGPFNIDTNWHRAYSQLQTKSEFCAICHNAVNRYGFEFKATFTEWKNSAYAKEGIQCQDCHMNVQGFLNGGRPVYESGKAAEMKLSTTPEREKIYTHQFPGAHSKTEVMGALTLAIETVQSAVSAGDEITIHVTVDNSRTGHKMPSGNIELRLLWLDIRAYTGDKAIQVAADSHSVYDVAGNGPLDNEMISSDIPDGNRIYRAVFTDKSGKQTLASYDATKIVFDNRLNAAEVRKETYRFRIPEGAQQTVTLVATLRYLPHSSSFAKRLGISRPEPVEIASAKKELLLISGDKRK